MLPGLRLVLVAITATIMTVVLGFAQLVKLQVAQSHSASFGPVEARFAGLAFAERVDWTPVATSQARSLEALAPFANLRPLQQPRQDRKAANASMPLQIAALERPAVLPDTPAVELTPATVASIGPTADPEAKAATSDPTSATEQAPQDSIPEAAKQETADNTAQDLGKTADAPVADVAALPPPKSALTPAVAALSPIEVAVAAVHAPVDPTPAALAATTPAATIPPAAAAPPQPPQQEASLPDNVPNRDAESGATEDGDRPNASVRLPIPRPALAALQGEIVPLPAQFVPLPAPRPATAPRSLRKAQLRPAKKKAARRRPAVPKPAQPAANAAPTNPFAQLFGG